MDENMRKREEEGYQDRIELCNTAGSTQCGYDADHGEMQATLMDLLGDLIQWAYTMTDKQPVN